MTDSELESLQCYPFHLPPVELGQKDRSASYRPLGGRDCGSMGLKEYEPCWGQVVREHRIYTGGESTLYYCQGHIGSGCKKYEEEV